MHAPIAILGLLLLNAQSFALQERAGCAAVPASPQPANLPCGQQGTLASAKKIRTVTDTNSGACRDLCLNNGACKTFSFALKGRVCTLYTTAANNFKASNSGVTFWSRKCYAPCGPQCSKPLCGGICCGPDETCGDDICFKPTCENPFSRANFLAPCGNATPTCVCFDNEGSATQGFCTPNFNCPESSECGSSVDCAAGQFCSTTSGCGFGVCLERDNPECFSGGSLGGVSEKRGASSGGTMGYSS